MKRLVNTVLFIHLLGIMFVPTFGFATQVQLGAFSDRSNAVSQSENFRDKGYQVQLQRTASGLNRVRVINLSDSEKKQLIQSLDRRNKNYFIIGEEPAPESQFENQTNKLNNSLPPMRFGHRVQLSQRIQNRLNKAIGTEYVWGGESFEEGGFDCSGLLVWLFRYPDIPRTSARMWGWTKRVKRKNMRPGDFIFFNFQTANKPDHVGLYLGDNRFVHASSTYGVIKANFSKKYYQKSLFGIGRPPEN